MAERPVWSVAVVVVHEDGEHPIQLPLVQDQQAIEAVRTLKSAAFPTRAARKVGNVGTRTPAGGRTAAPVAINARTALVPLRYCEAIKSGV